MKNFEKTYHYVITKQDKNGGEEDLYKSDDFNDTLDCIEDAKNKALEYRDSSSAYRIDIYDKNDIIDIFVLYAHEKEWEHHPFDA